LLLHSWRKQLAKLLEFQFFNFAGKFV